MEDGMDDGIFLRFTKEDAYKLLLILLGFEVFMVVVYILDDWSGLQSPINRLFNLDAEATLTSWFSSLQLGLVGIVFLVTWLGARKTRIESRLHLLLIGLGFLFLSMDEAAEFHEKLTRVLRHVEWLPQMAGGIWIPIYFAIALILGICVRKSLFAMWENYPREVLIMSGGFAVILIGGVGLEILTHLYWKGQDPFMYKLEVIFEEFFEMAGASILLYGALLHSIRYPGLSKEPR
jgi:hypothetical protein